MPHVNADIPSDFIKIGQNICKSDRAKAGIYYIGTTLGLDASDNLIKPAAHITRSDFSGSLVVGRVVTRQTVADDGGPLNYEIGDFLYQNEGSVTDIDRNKIVFFDPTFATQAFRIKPIDFARLPIGRFRGFVTGSNAGDCIISVGNLANEINELAKNNTPVRLITGSYKATLIDEFIKADATLGQILFTLPVPNFDNTGKRYSIKKIDATGFRVVVTGSRNIDDQPRKIIECQYSSMTVVSDGIKWWII